MKLSTAAFTLVVARSVSAICDSQITIEVPSGVTGLSFVNYIVDPTKFTRSIGTVRFLICCLSVPIPIVYCYQELVRNSVAVGVLSDIRLVFHNRQTESF